MNKNTVTGIILIFALMIGYSIYMSPSQEELEKRKRIQDSINLVQQYQKDPALDTMSDREVVATENPSQFDSINEVQGNTKDVTDRNRELYGAFAQAVTGNDNVYILESDLLKLTITAKGGRIGSVELKNYKTHEGKPLVLFNRDSSDFNVGFFADMRSINTHDFYFIPESSVNFSEGNLLKVTGNDSIKLSMRLYAGSTDSLGVSDKYIEFLYTLIGNSYMVDYKINFVNMNSIVAANNKGINIDWMSRLLRHEKNLENERNNSTVYYRHADTEVDYLTERKDGKIDISTPVNWVSYTQQFFSSTFIADKNFSSVSIEKQMEPDQETKYLQKMMTTVSMPYNMKGDPSFDFSFYFGPNKYNILRKFKLDLERQIPLGWSFFLLQWINRYAVIPVFNFLEGFNLNYGIIILILTILLKIVLFPIAMKTYISSAKMRLLKPEIDEINTKFPKSEDALKKQQATMALYKKAGVNPMAGCVPMLLQFPILIALFRFFPSSIELRQEAFLWAEDLSSYDSVLSLPFTIPFYGNHVSLFTLLMTISTIIYTKINNDMMSTGNQMPGMKTMMYLMPIMFLGFFNSYSSGLSYYYLLANLITFAQMYFMRRFVDEKKLHAQIQENKKKPVKKSNFQRKLEEMAKQQQKKR